MQNFKKGGLRKEAVSLTRHIGLRCVQNTGRGKGFNFYHCCHARSSELHLHIDTSRKIKLHKRIDGLSSRVENINHALVSPDFEMEPSILVNVGRLENTVDTLLGWQWNRTHGLCVSISCSVKYLLA